MTFRRQMAWLLTLAAGICLGVAASGLSQPANNREVLTPPPTHSPDDLSTIFREVAAKVLPAVVSIKTEVEPQQITRGTDDSMPPETELFRRFFGNDPRFEQFFDENNIVPRFTPRRQGAGSGFIVDSQGIVLTNSHVVEGADRVVVVLADGREVVADSWNFDPRTDVAIIRIKVDEELPTLVLGDSDQMQVGDWVLALGNPFNVGTSVTSGIVSATGRGPHINEREQFIQTDAAINPGNSGGPLVNLFGEVIGVNTAINTRSGGYDGIGFAIPSNMVRWVANQLIEHGDVKRSYLGVALQSLTNELRVQMNIPWGKGALVSEVRDDSPASRAQVQPGDVILEFAGREIGDADDLVDIVERSASGKTYDMKVLREGKEVTIPVKLEPMPDDYTEALRRARMRDRSTQKEKPQDEVIDRLGLQVTDLDADLAKQLGLSNDVSGVVIRSVTPGSPAAEKNLRAGDIIQRVGTKPVKNVAEFRAAVENVDLAEGLLLHVKRGDGAMFVVLKKTN